MKIALQGSFKTRSPRLINRMPLPLSVLGLQGEGGMTGNRPGMKGFLFWCSVSP